MPLSIILSFIIRRTSEDGDLAFFWRYAVSLYLLKSTEPVLAFLSGLVWATSLHCDVLALHTDPPIFLLVSRDYLAALAQDLVDSSNIKAPRRRSILITNSSVKHTFSNHILTMKFTSTIVSLAALFAVASADTVRFNTFYDNPGTSLNNVACSNGKNGLVTKGFTTFGSLPSFPSVGGVFAVKGWNSTECGSCWKLTYGSESIYVTAIDTISDGFDISLKAMNILTNNQAQKLNSIDAQATQVATSFCSS